MLGLPVFYVLYTVGVLGDGILQPTGVLHSHAAGGDPATQGVGTGQRHLSGTQGVSIVHRHLPGTQGVGTGQRHLPGTQGVGTGQRHLPGTPGGGHWTASSARYTRAWALDSVISYSRYTRGGHWTASSARYTRVM